MALQAPLGPDDLITGEAVALELPAAGLAARLGAGLIDVALAGLVLFLSILTMNFVLPELLDEAARAAITVLSVITALLVLPTAGETLTRGKTLGKAICGIRTVREDGGPIAFRHAITRALIGVIEIWATAGGPALICALITSRTRRLGDLAAGTFVVRDRVRLTLPPPVPMPPHLRAWADPVDLGRLPDRWAMAARQLLYRADRFTPAARAALTSDLAAEASGALTPAPPEWATADDVIRAVLALRRERDSARLARQAATRRRWFPAEPVE